MDLSRLFGPSVSIDDRRSSPHTARPSDEIMRGVTDPIATIQGWQYLNTPPPNNAYTADIGRADPSFGFGVGRPNNFSNVLARLMGGGN